MFGAPHNFSKVQISPCTFRQSEELEDDLGLGVPSAEAAAEVKLLFDVIVLNTISMSRRLAV